MTSFSNDMPEPAALQLRTPGQVNSVLTIRGIFLAVFLIYLLVVPSSREADIVAGVIAYTFLCIGLLLVVITLLNARLIKSKLSLQIAASPTTGSPVLRSREETLFVLMMSTIRIFPFFGLRMQIQFTRNTLHGIEHYVQGHIEANTKVIEHIFFPHRGPWEISGIRCVFGDQLGITELLWTVNLDGGSTYEVYPPIAQNPSLPVVSSCNRAGDMVMDVREKKGEPFDIKRYHPGDSPSKILWKVFARTGELLSRHPEPSMTPEGQVVLFCLARTIDDFTCASCIDYIQRLEDLDLEVLLGCPGIGGNEPADSLDAAEHLLTDCAWRAEGASPESVREELSLLLAAASKKFLESSVSRVVLFTGSNRIADEREHELLRGAAEFLEYQGISPSFFIIHEPELSRDKTSLPLKERLESLLWIPEKSYREREDHSAPLLSLCASRQWDVILSEELR